MEAAWSSEHTAQCHHNPEYHDMYKYVLKNWWSVRLGSTFTEIVFQSNIIRVILTILNLKL